MSEGPPRRKRIFHRDLQEAADLDFSEEEEHWNKYKLSDGTTLKVKLVLQAVKRLKKHNPDGFPVYVIQSHNIVRALNVRDEFKVKPKKSTFQPV